MLKKKFELNPIMAFIILTVIVIVFTGFLHLLNVQAEYTTVNTITNELTNNVIEVKNLFSTSGIRHIVTTAVDGFVNFAPLATLIIVLIGIGVLEKTGFTRTFFTLLTKNSKKNVITFLLVFICLCFSLVGDIGFVVMLPLGALLFKYGRRNPLGGIITSFASLSFGYGINVLLSSNDCTLLNITLNAAKLLDVNYTIGMFFALFIMIFALILMSIIFTIITEKKIMPSLPRYESDEEYTLTNRDLRGMIIGLGAGLIYVLIVIYMIIPGLPLSGALLDHSATRYIEMVFGENSLFNQGFVFIVTMFFVVVGFGNGLMNKTIKRSKDITESLAYSLDGIGNIIVLLFFASLFINVYQESNIGAVLTAWVSNIIGSLSFTGSLLIVISFILIALVNIFNTGSLVKWNMLSGTIVPLFMNASISPEFAQVIYTAADSVTNGLTPLCVYFVIYLAFLEKYSKDETVTLRKSIKYMSTYSFYAVIIWITILLACYLIGLPIGIGTFPGVTYGA